MRCDGIRAFTALAALSALVACAAPAGAQDHPDHDHDHPGPHAAAARHLAHAEHHGGFPAFVDVFFTHHAYLERKLHPRFDASFAGEGRQYGGSGEIVWQFGRRLGAELSGGVVSTDPDEGSGATGVTDLEVAPMLAISQDVDRLLIVTVRSGFVLPTGDAEEGLGIDGWGWEPGLLVWKGFGPEKRGALQAELGYERLFADSGADEEELVYNLALSYWLPSNWIPVLELNGVTPIGSRAAEDHHAEPGTAGRGLVPAHGETVEAEETVVAATLGFRYAFANQQQWGAAVQLPLTGGAPFDARLVVGGIIHVR